MGNVYGEKLNILQALHFPLEGAGTGHYVHTLSSRLIEGGHNVGVVYAQSPKCARRDTCYKRFPVNFKTKSLNFPFPVFESHPLGEDLTFGSINQEHLTLYLNAFERKLDEAIDIMKPDVVNVHHGWVLGGMLSRKGIPYFVNLHGTELKAFELYKGYQNEAIKGLRGAQGIIVSTEDQKEKAIKKYGLSPDKFSIITTGIDTDFFSPIEESREQLLNKVEFPLRKDQPVILYVGRLTQVKGVEYLVESAIHLKQNKKIPKILVVGDGILKNQLANVKETYNLCDLNFLGRITTQQILYLYNYADLVAVPSLEDCFPLVPLEAMSCGTPVIGTNISGGLNMQLSGLEKVVGNKINRKVSLRVPVRDSNALASKMVETLELNLKDNLRRPIRKWGEQFSLSDMIHNINNLYLGVA